MRRQHQYRVAKYITHIPKSTSLILMYLLYYLLVCHVIYNQSKKASVKHVKTH